MEQPTNDNGPDYPDGTDAEGFPDGDQRFGLIKPTKEEVEEIRELIVPFAGSGRLSTRFELIIRLCDAYLALREEVDTKDGHLKDYMEILHAEQERNNRLQADNEALRAKLATSITYGAPQQGEPLSYTIEEDEL